MDRQRLQSIQLTENPGSPVEGSTEQVALPREKKQDRKKCPVDGCGKTYADNSKLNRHIRYVANEPNKQTWKEHSDALPEKRKCDICQREDLKSGYAKHVDWCKRQKIQNNSVYITPPSNGDQTSDTAQPLYTGPPGSASLPPANQTQFRNMSFDLCDVSYPERAPIPMPQNEYDWSLLSSDTHVEFSIGLEQDPVWYENSVNNWH